MPTYYDPVTGEPIEKKKTYYDPASGTPIGTTPRPERTSLSLLEEPAARNWAKQSGVDLDDPDTDYRAQYKLSKGKPLALGVTPPKVPSLRERARANMVRLDPTLAEGGTAEVRRRNEAGEDILQSGLRRGSDAEQLGSYLSDFGGGLVKGTAEMGGLAVDAVRNQGLMAKGVLTGRGVSPRELTALPATRAAGEAANRWTEAFKKKVGLEGVEIGAAGPLASLTGEFAAPGPDIAVAGKGLRSAGMGRISDAINATLDASKVRHPKAAEILEYAVERKGVGADELAEKFGLTQQEVDGFQELLRRTDYMHEAAPGKFILKNEEMTGAILDAGRAATTPIAATNVAVRSSRVEDAREGAERLFSNQLEAQRGTRTTPIAQVGDTVTGSSKLEDEWYAADLEAARLDQSLKGSPVSEMRVGERREPSMSATRERVERNLARRRSEIATEFGRPADDPVVARAAKADIDTRTGAYSANAFEDAKGSEVAATAVDLAHLGKINDSPIGREYGDLVGDEMLATMARVLDSVAGDAGKVYRRGGDEFAILWNDPTNADTLWRTIGPQLDEALVQIERHGQIEVEWKGIRNYVYHGRTADEASAGVNRQKPLKDDYATRDALFAPYRQQIEAGWRNRPGAPAGRSGLPGSVGENSVQAPGRVTPPPIEPPGGSGGMPPNDLPSGNLPGRPIDTSLVRSAATDPTPGTSGFDADAYAAEMTARREAARGSAAQQTSKIRTLLRQAKAGAVDYLSPIEDVVHGFAKERGVTIAAEPPTPGQTARALLSGESIPLTKDGKLLPSKDIRNALDRSIMSGEISGQFMRDRGLDKVIRDAPKLENLEQYATAKHAITLFYQRWGKHVNTGGNQAARFKRLSAIYDKHFGRDLLSDGRMTKAFEAEYEPLAQQLHKYSHDLLDYSVESGLVKKELADKLKVLYPYYVPLKRVFSVLEKETIPLGTGGGPGSLSQQTVMRKFVGSEREIESPIESLITKTQEAFSQGERNKAAKLLASYRSWEGNPLQIRELRSGEHAAHTFSYLEDGVKRTFATTPEIAAAAKALNVEQMSLVSRVLAVPARLLKVGATGLNVAFLAKNPIRDIPTAIINSEAGFGVAKEIGRGIFEAVGHGKFYDDLVREGGMFTSFDQFRAPAKESVEAIRSQRSAGARIKYLVTNPGEMLRAVEDIVARGEQAGRVAVASAEYKRALASGLPKDEALISAKQAALWNTGPFHRHGEWGRVIQAAAPYLNAGIQGQRVTLGALRNRPVVTVSKMAVTTLIPVAIFTAWNLSDPERKKAYDDIKEFEKENSIIIVPPNPTYDDKTRMWDVIKIPLPQAVAKWATLLRRPIEAASGLDPVRFGEVAQALLGTVSPVSSGNEVGSNVVPQAVKPPLEVSLNKNFFTRGDIVQRNLLTKPVEEQVQKETSGSARLLGKITGMSPLEVEHLIRGYGAGVGMQGLNAADRILAFAGIVPEEQVGGEGPVAMTKRGFYGARAMTKRQKEERDDRRRGGGGAATPSTSDEYPTNLMKQYPNY